MVRAASYQGPLPQLWQHARRRPPGLNHKLSDATKSPLDAAAYTYDVYVTRVHAYPDDGCIQRSGMERLLQVLATAGQIEGAPPVEKYIDRQWCPS